MDKAMAVGAPARLSTGEKVLIGIAIYFIALKLIFAFGAEPLTDEAYYWMWGRHFELSYYDHPPLQAWLQGLSHAVFGTNLFALRWPTFAASAAVLWIFYLTAQRVGGTGWRPMFLTSAVVYLASPLFGFFGTVAMLDYLLVVLMMGSGYCFICYFTDIESGQRGKLLHLFAGAVLLGLAGLTKYTAVFLALAVAGAIITRPTLRPLLLRWELYAAALVTLALQLPVLIWNAQTGFGSFLYQTVSRHEGAHFTGISVAGMKTFVVETAALISPFILVPVTLLFFWARQSTAFERVGKTLAIWLFWLASLTFLYVSNFSWVLWWWNIVAFVLVLPFAGRYIGPVALGLHVAWGAAINTFLAISFAVVPLGNYVGGLLTMETDYAYGWQGLASTVREAQAEHGAELIVVNRFQSASQLAFALDDPDVVAIAPSRDTFDDWFDPAAHVGEAAIVLVVRRDDTEYWKPYFSSIRLLREIPVERFGQPLATYELWLGEDFAPPP